MHGSAERAARRLESPLHATHSVYCHPYFFSAACLTEPVGGCRLLSPCVSVSPLLRACQSFRACRHWPWRGSHKAWLLASPVRPQQRCWLRAFRTHWHPSELLPASRLCWLLGMPWVAWPQVPVC